VYTARACTSVLRYEARSFVPTNDERVPCRRPGYCGVIAPACPGNEIRSCESDPGTTAGANGLLEWLEDRPVTTSSALRRQPFALRLLQ
jgi:hypothetical protein